MFQESKTQLKIDFVVLKYKAQKVLLLEKFELNFKHNRHLPNSISS